MISPTVPAAHSVCPKLLLADPSAHGTSSRPYTADRLPNSIGSPTGVPVPWASTIPTVAGSTPAAPNADRYDRTLSFMSLLEMIKMQEVNATQDRVYGEIEITKRTKD